MADMYAAAPASLGLRVETVAGATLLLAPRIPVSYFNRAIGLGMFEPATEECLDAIIERLMASEGYQTMLSALPPDTLHAQPETMITLLDRVRDRYGSMRDYARAAGVSDDAMERLDARLLVR